MDRLTEYFWNLFMDGDGENVYECFEDCASNTTGGDCDCEGYLVYTRFDIEAEDRVEFPELRDSTEARLYGEGAADARVEVN